MRIKKFDTTLGLLNGTIQSVFSMNFIDSEYTYDHNLFYQNRDVFYYDQDRNLSYMANHKHMVE